MEENLSLKFFFKFVDHGLENSTRPLVFTSASGCRAVKNLIFPVNINFIPIYRQYFCDAGQVPIFNICRDLGTGVCKKTSI